MVRKYKILQQFAAIELQNGEKKKKIRNMSQSDHCECASRNRSEQMACVKASFRSWIRLRTIDSIISDDDINSCSTLFELCGLCFRSDRVKSSTTLNLCERDILKALLRRVLNTHPRLKAEYGCYFDTDSSDFNLL